MLYTYIVILICLPFIYLQCYTCFPYYHRWIQIFHLQCQLSRTTVHARLEVAVHIAVYVIIQREIIFGFDLFIINVPISFLCLTFLKKKKNIFYFLFFYFYAASSIIIKCTTTKYFTPLFNSKTPSTSSSCLLKNVSIENSFPNN